MIGRPVTARLNMEKRTVQTVKLALAGGIGVGLLTFACHQFNLDFGIPALLYMLVIVAVSRSGNITASLLVCAIALGSLNYFFVSPRYSMRVAEVQFMVALLAFLATALVICHLMRKARKALDDLGALHKTQQELRRQTAHLDGLFELAPSAIAMVRLDPPTVIRINREFTRLFGYAAHEANGRSLRELIALDGSPAGQMDDAARIAADRPVESEVTRRGRDGRRICAQFAAARIQLADGTAGAYLIYRDITERKIAEASLAGEKRLLEMLAKGDPLSLILEGICRLVEEVYGDCKTAILLLDGGGRLWHAAAPSLPRSYIDAIDGCLVGEGIGPCPLAAHLGEPVIVTDMRADSAWPAYAALADSHGLRASASTPILSSTGRVFGTFALFSLEPGVPIPQQRSIIEQFSHLASSAIERKRTEAELQRSEQGYALAMEAAREGHWDWIVEPDEFYGSPRMLEIYGFPSDTVFSGRQDFLDRFPFHPEDRPKWEQAAEAHFAGRDAHFEMDLRLIRNDEVRWIHLSALCSRNSDGLPARWTGAVSDITDRKRDEVALRESEERFALAVAGSADGVWDWDIASNMMFLSERAQRIYGLEPGVTVRLRTEWRAMVTIHPEDAEGQLRVFEDYVAGVSKTCEGEWRALHPDGSFRWVRVRGICVRDQQGVATRMAGSVSDIDSHRRAEAALRQAMRLDAVGTLAGGIAHDFNNILAAILGYGEMASRSAPAGSRLRRDLDSIISAGERGRALVERILAFSRSGVGERVPVHVEAVVQETLDLTTASLPSGVKIEVRLRAGRAAVLGDPTQIHQVLMNLLANAVQAMPQGGDLLVCVDTLVLHEPRMLTTGPIQPGPWVMLTVSDSGTGIQPGVVELIFDPFFTTKEVGQGTGLGLSLVHGIVTELTGAVDVATAIGEGTTFAIYLPRIGDAPESPAAERPALAQGNHQRILVVDDEAGLAQLTVETLVELQYDPVGFTSSLAALDAFRKDPSAFDAVITDEAMPGMSGSSLIRELRQIRESIPALLVSGYLGGTVIIQGRQAGADEVLRKPLSARDLATCLARIFQYRARCGG